MNNYFCFIREAIPDNSDFKSESKALKDFFEDPDIDVEEYIKKRNEEEKLLIAPAF